MSSDHTVHKLGIGHGAIISHTDGTVEYRQTAKFVPAFRVSVADVTGFSVRKATRGDKKSLGATSGQFILSIQGSGTLLAEVAVNALTPPKIEEWFRSHPNFGQKPVQAQGAGGGSVADELAKLAQLRDAGVLSDQEFQLQKSRLLS